MEVYVVRDLDLLCVHLEDCFTSGKIRQLNGNSAVETSGTRQRGVKGFGAVCCRQNNYAAGALKAVHFRKQLVECLFALIVAAELTVALFADSVDLVYEYDTGRFFLCLPEQVAYL